MKLNIAVISGDGVGPEVIAETLLVLEKIGERYGHTFHFTEALGGGCAIDQKGEPLPKETIDICKKSDAILFGAVGGSKWDHLSGEKRPERAILNLRSELGLYANIRPAVLYKELEEASPLKPQVIGDGIDICVVRELTGGMYFGKKGRREDGKMGKEAYDTEAYSVGEVERIARMAFEIAKKRNKKVTNVDKANVLESSKLWRSVVKKVSEEYSDVALNHMYVDNATMQLIGAPNQFDVVVTTNMFGDILSDLASKMVGSIGMLPSASLGDGKLGLYEPIHGSAPDIAGENKANPIASIVSAAMMLRYSFGLEEQAQTIENAVVQVLQKNYRTADILSSGMREVGTKEMGEAIRAYL
jgi:3-isopropylmalate dehydrogenase